MEKLNVNNSDQVMAATIEREPLNTLPANQNIDQGVKKATRLEDDALYSFSSDDDDSYLSENELLSSFLNPPPKNHHSKAFSKSHGSMKHLNASR
jgi:hypothetical protein